MSLPVRGVALVAAALVSVPSVATAAGPAPAPGSRTTAGRAAGITWEDCGRGLQCGELTVPLDHARPDTGTITLRLARRPAEDQAHRVGSIFTSPGGPGLAVPDQVGQMADKLGPEVRKRFDVVGLATRGADASCTAAGEDPDLPGGGVVFPATADEQRVRLTVDGRQRALCAKGAPQLLDHMSTADAARDLDLARAALGDERLTYYGTSYGTYLGQTYAALFPDKVRAMVLDGVIDPVEWSTGRDRGTLRPLTERLGSHLGAKEALEAAFAECERVGAARCPSAATVRQDWADLVAATERGPVALGDGRELRYDELHSTVLRALYSADQIPGVLTTIHDLRAALPARIPSRAMLAAPRARKKATAALKQLHALARAAEATSPAAQEVPIDPRPQPGVDRRPGVVLPGLHGPRPTTTPTRRPTPAPRPTATPTTPPSKEASYWVGYSGVLCSDAVNPSDPQEWVSAAERAKAAAGASARCGPGPRACAPAGRARPRGSTAAPSTRPRPRPS